MKNFTKLLSGWGIMLLMFQASCSKPQEQVFYKTGQRDQLQIRSIERCHGDFILLQEDEFGPYTRATLECNE